MTRETVSGAVLGTDQRLTLEEAVRACTIDAAASYFADDRLGSIEGGKLADLVVLDGDLFTTPTERIADLGIALTIVDGAVAYRSERFSATSDNIS
jgi:predicted amidohydrolase YtcJ